jgi:uncharacterized protein
MMALLGSVPDVSPMMFFGLTALAAFTSGFGVVAGLGGGVLLLGVMALVFPPATVIPLHGMVQFGTSIGRIVLMRRYVLTAPLAAFAAGALIGAGIGGQLVVSLPTALLQAILGGFLLYVCWAPRVVGVRLSRRKFFFLCAAGALLSMFVGATATILAPFVVGVSPDRRHYVATQGALMIMVHGLKAVAFGLLGFAFGPYLPLLAAMVAAGFAGTWVGSRLLDHMPERLFRTIFRVVLIVLAVRLLYGAFTSWQI